MTIPIPATKVGQLNQSEREWLMRVRGTTLSQVADSANQLLFRSGLNCIHKRWTYAFDRVAKANGAGNYAHSVRLFQENIGKDFLVPILQPHPGAVGAGMLLTYCAPNDIDDQYDSNATANGAGESRIKIRLLYGGSTVTHGAVIDPPSSSNLSYAVDLQGDDMPHPRIIRHENNTYEYEDTSGIRLDGQDAEGHANASARVLRTLFHFDYGSSESERPRRFQYGSAAGGLTPVPFILQMWFWHAVPLEVTFFEIPRLSV